MLPGLLSLPQLPQLELGLRTDTDEPDDCDRLRGMQDVSALHALHISPADPDSNYNCIMPAAVWDRPWTQLTCLTLEAVHLWEVDPRVLAGPLACLRRLHMDLSPFDCRYIYPEALCSLAQLTYLVSDGSMVCGCLPLHRPALASACHGCLLHDLQLPCFATLADDW